jgi:hypothetical protein
MAFGQSRQDDLVQFLHIGRRAITLAVPAHRPDAGASPNRRNSGCSGFLESWPLTNSRGAGGVWRGIGGWKITRWVRCNQARQVTFSAGALERLLEDFVTLRNP